MEIVKGINITNEDNMQLMARYPDNYFDLAIVDPPYGIGASKPTNKSKKVKQKNGSKIYVKDSEYHSKEWDEKPPSEEYFNELFRVSKNQIIWGVNYFNYPFSAGRLVWDKMNGESDQYDCEIAFNSLNKRTDIVRFMWSGMIQGKTPSRLISKANIQQGNKKLNEKRIHQTQKPVKLYEYILLNYAQSNWRVLDTNLGSGSIALACYKLGFELTACELDYDHYKDSLKRIKEQTAQQTLF